ncbi:hypothetical protein OS189_17140 [Sulfitobacter sp. F26169L]|uniref:hypothetical protein n=1 Tax=Sulfitobacter sp. F26169L TaxID=2996015 RepID=UPI002260FA71|nr:hypothetical protein [Sulfitobacter sp. F26169L]MCX7568070.1 hypothetical protein [Sulfitobacter sp. F26169L]
MPPRKAARCDRIDKNCQSITKNGSQLMKNDCPDTQYDDLISFVYDLPPVASPDRYSIASSATRFPHASLAEARISGTHHPVIGITAAGWMMIGGVGWRLIKADKTVTHRIACACNRLQRHLLTDLEKFDQAYERHVLRTDQSKIAGLVQTPLEPGRYVVRPSDITSRRTKDRLDHYLDDPPPQNDTDDPSFELPDGYVSSEVWWQFAWRMTHSTT